LAGAAWRGLEETDMRKVIAIAWKDALVRFSSPSEWLFFLVLPIVFTLVISGIAGAGDSRIRLLVADQVDTPLSRLLVSELRSGKALRVETLALEKANREFSARRAPALLVIQRDPDAASGAPGALDLRLQPDTPGAVAAQQAVRRAAARIGGAAGIDETRPLVTLTLALTPDAVRYDPGASASAGQLLTWVFIPLIALSSLFASERKKGTLKRLLVSPTSRATCLVGTIAGQVAVALVQMILLVAFGIAVMKLPWARAPGALAVILACSALSAAALGTMMGTFVKSEAQADGLSILIGMVMALLGGCWYPMDLFPSAVRTAMKALPTTWAMEGLLDILVRGQGLAAVLPSAAVLLGFSVVFFTVGIVRFRWE
jgi:ABC-2 type transport system permease protein